MAENVIILDDSSSDEDLPSYASILYKKPKITDDEHSTILRNEVSWVAL